MITFRYSLLIFCIMAACFGTSFSFKTKPMDVWCYTRTCGSLHIACNNTGKFSPICLPGSKVVEIYRLRNLIIDLFNNFRNKVAGGHYNYLVKAARMAKMSWSQDLEFLAGLNVKSCRVLRSSCMSTMDFTYIGMNSEIYSYIGPKAQYSDYELIRIQMFKWFDQIQNVDNDTCLYFPNKLRNPDIAKVTIAIAEKNTHVGCAALRYSHELYHYFLFTCAFATNNFIHRPLYTFALTAGSRCKKRDFRYSHLCDLTENYDNVSFMPGVKIYQYAD